MMIDVDYFKRRYVIAGHQAGDGAYLLSAPRRWQMAVRAEGDPGGSLRRRRVCRRVAGVWRMPPYCERIQQKIREAGLPRRRWRRRSPAVSGSSPRAGR